MSEQKCPCVNCGGEAVPLPVPVDVIDLPTPLYEACGGRTYRLHIRTYARYIEMADGVSVEERVNTIERAQAANTTLRFAENIRGRDGLAGLVPGDMCHVFDASGDGVKGAAMYLWLPSMSWVKVWEGDSPMDMRNWVVPGGGIITDEKGDRLLVECGDLASPKGGLKKAEDGKLAVACAWLIHDGGGLGLCENGKIKIEIGDLIKARGGLAADENGRLYVRADDLFDAGKGLAVDKFGHLYISLEDLLASGGGLSVDKAGNLQVKLADLIGSGGGLSVDENGNLAIDLSGMTEEDVRGLIACILKEGNGLKVDEDGRIVFDPEDLPASVINISKVNLENITKQQKTILGKAIAAELIHKNGGLGVHADDGLLFVDFESMDKSIMRDVVLGMIRKRGGLSADENGKLYVDFNNLDEDGKADLLKAIKVPVWMTASRTFHVNPKHANAGDIQPVPLWNGTEDYDAFEARRNQVQTLNGKRGTADYPFDTIQHALDHVCANYNVDKYTATIRLAAGFYDEDVTLPNFSYTSGHVTIAGTGNISFDDAGNVTSTLETTFRGRFADSGGGNFYVSNMRLRPDPAANSFWTDSVYPIRVAGRDTTLTVTSCQIEPPAASKGASDPDWFALWSTGGSVIIHQNCVFTGLWDVVWNGQTTGSFTLARTCLFQNVSVANAVLYLSNASFSRAGASNSNLAVIKVAGDPIAGVSYKASLNSVISLRGLASLIPGAEGQLYTGSQQA